MRRPCGVTAKRGEKQEVDRMRKEAKMVLIVSLLMAAFLGSPAKAEVDITVTTDGDVDVDLDTYGDGALLSVDYNGRDVLAELEDKMDALADLRVAMVFIANQRKTEKLEDEIEALEADIKKLVEQLNHAFGDVYFKLGMQAHVIGINPGNTSISITLISGNKTVADFLQENRDEITFLEHKMRDSLDAIDARITALDNEINVILAEQAQDIDSNNESIQEIQGYLDERREYIDERLIEIDGKFLMTYVFMAGTIIVLIALVYLRGEEYKKLNDRLKLLEPEPIQDLEAEEQTPL